MTLHLVIRGVSDAQLPVVADGQLELPKEPPFEVLTPGPAAVVTLHLEPESRNCIRLFNAWYQSDGRLDVTVFDGVRTRIRGAMRCVAMEHMDGLQITRPWTEPMRRAQVNGHCLLYRPTPRWQPIARPIHRYVLHADRYQFVSSESLDGIERRNEARPA